MKYIKFLFVGIIFGLVMAKAEIISWYRIYEMFQFGSFHMYGVIGSAVVLGAIMIQLMKRSNMSDIAGEQIKYSTKDSTYTANIVGGAIFGLGWAMVGACPGPLFVLLGYGYVSILVVILGAIIGAFFYGLLKKYLPH